MYTESKESRDQDSGFRVQGSESAQNSKFKIQNSPTPSSLIPHPSSLIPSLSDPQPSIALLAENPLNDDRETIQTGDHTLLIIEDDPNFARILLDMARQRGFKSLAAMRGDVGLAMARTFKPTAIMLDIDLPVLDGWQILIG